MTDCTPVKGDRVRVVVEGEVTTVFDGGFTTRWNAFEHKHVVSVEKVVPPLPQAIGSTLHCRDSGFAYFLTRNGWIDERGFAVSETDVIAANDCGREHVIFDAGKAS